MKKLLITLSIAFIGINLFSQSFLPKSKGEIVKHTYYTLSYSEANEQVEWVYYELIPSIISGETSRTDDFRSDPLVSTGSAELSDYKGSGYDRGHLCPAAAMKINHVAMSETFYLSNMSPQAASFNRGRWKELEAKVRTWAYKEEILYVVSGPVFRNNIGTIGTNKVTIPGYYYKVIYSPQNNQMIAFIMPNRKIEESLSGFVVTVDSVEALTGIDFFEAMEDIQEASLENKVNKEHWSFDMKDNFSSPNDKNSTAVQCKGMAKSTGKRCKIMTTNANEYCRYHQSQAVKGE